MKYFLLIALIVVLAITFERITLPETTPEMTQTARTYGVQHNKPIPPKPFTYDGCSFFPDTVLTISLEDACLEHDIAYWHGGTRAERKAADQRLQEAVAETGVLGQILQQPVYIGVRLLGDSPLTRAVGAHWGFGHK